MATYRSKLEQIAEQISNYSPFSSKYDSAINNYQNQVANFNNTNQNWKKAQEINNTIAGGKYFDPETDRTYQQYKRSYIDNGQRAMDDTLGMASARTGGLASSYAMTAANQTYNNYMKQLTDKIPELENAARQRLTEDYSRYLGLSDKERSALQGLVDSYRGLRSDEFNQQYIPGYNRTKDAFSSYSTLEQMAMQDEALAAQQAAAAARASSGGSGRRSSYYDDDEPYYDDGGSIGNIHNDSSVYVDGYGNVSYSKLQSLVDNGDVEERYYPETGQYYYIKKKTYTHSDGTTEKYTSGINYSKDPRFS